MKTNEKGEKILNVFLFLYFFGPYLILFSFLLTLGFGIFSGMKPGDLLISCPTWKVLTFLILSGLTCLLLLFYFIGMAIDRSSRVKEDEVEDELL